MTLQNEHLPGRARLRDFLSSDICLLVLQPTNKLLLRLSHYHIKVGNSMEKNVNKRCISEAISKNMFVILAIIYLVRPQNFPKITKITYKSKSGDNKC